MWHLLVCLQTSGLALAVLQNEGKILLLINNPVVLSLELQCVLDNIADCG